MLETPDRVARQNLLTERDFRVATEQYGHYADRITELQREREIWIRHSILATFAFFGWFAVNQESVSQTLMLEAYQLQLIYLIPLIFNLGGALRFFFIQRDINRHVEFLVDMERGVLCLPDAICDAPKGRGLRDRHWHWPSICYWAFIAALSALAGAVLAFDFPL